MRPTRGMTPARRVPGTPARATSLESINSDAEKVAVYCRIRPLSSNDEDGEESSARLEGDNVVALTPPESSRAYRGGGKETHYTFTKAFGENSMQKEVFEQVGLPLVKDLVTGWNSLLFMYGVTGSGKTHTMQGTPADGGVMARAIDVIFNSLQGRQVERKRLIVPDGFNGFTVQSSAQAMVDRQQELINDRQRPRQQRNNLSSEIANLSDRNVDESVVSEVDQKFVYAIFVTYVEVYNEKIFDLLDTDPRDTTRSKDLRVDSCEWQYVHGCVEVQVQNPREALETFYRGQRRRRVGHTVLNAHSSRSHSIFTIRLVKAHPAPDGEVNADLPIEVSQLSLVDMAGSERTNRTGNRGEKLAEASSINNSLTTLRRCIKQLRDNQKRGRRDHVPYRDSQITKMFGSFFDGKPGNGTLRMMVCINPRASDFDENVNIMEFAETAQKIQIERVEPIPRELFTPGRTLGNKAYSEALRREREANTPSVNPTNSVYSPIYSLGPDWPPLEVGRCDDEETLENLEHYLMKRVATRNTLIEDHNNQVEQFRARLVEAEQRIALLDNENMKLKHGGDGERRRVRDLETRLVNAEAANNSLQKKNTALNEAKSVLEKELDDKELLINNNKKNQKRSARKLQSQLSEQEAINNDLAHKLLEEEAKKDRQMYDRARLRAVRSIVGDKNPALLNKTLSDPNMSTVGKENTPWKRKPMSSAKSNPNVTLTPAHPRRSVAVANPRYRRSRSTGAVWIDHQPQATVPSDTIMQPKNWKNKRSVTKLSEKDIVDSKCTNYAITTHGQDTDGDIETIIYKGEVIPTVCGGTQVILTDKETLKHKSPIKSPERIMTRRSSKRSFEEAAEAMSVGSRVAAFEHKTGPTKKYRYY